MKAYEVTARKSGDWWVLQATDSPGAISQVKKLADANIIREAIAWVDRVPESEIEVHLVPHVDSEVDPLLEQYRALVVQSREIEVERSELQRRLARGLASHGVSYRDAGELLGISHQRIGQLVKP